jgi:hypothetical protein
MHFEGSPRKRRNSTEKIQQLTIRNLHFLFLWDIFALLDPDPDTYPKSMHIHANPDPKHCL